MTRRTAVERRAEATPRVQRRGEALYWEPSATLRAAGFAGVALGPLSPAALNRADELNAAADAHLATARARRSRVEKPQLVTVGALFAAFRAARLTEDGGLSDASRTHYRAALRRLDDVFGPEAIGAIDGPAVDAWLRVASRRTKRQAHNDFRMLRQVFGWAMAQGLCPLNPCAALRPKAPPHRRRIATRAELAALVATADAMGRRSVGDAVIICATTFQRVGDVLRLTTKNLRGGLVSLRQQKTGKSLTFDAHPALVARLGPLDGVRHLVVSEGTGKGYQYCNFNRWWSRVRAEAARTTPSLLGEDPSVDDPNYVGALEIEDFRRTGMVWASQGGAQIEWICSVSGHEIDHGTSILEVYIPRERSLAARAIARLDIFTEPADDQAKGKRA